MKLIATLTPKNAKWHLASVALLGIVISFSSCKTDNDFQAQPVAALAVTNASLTAKAVDFYIGPNKVNYSPLTLGATTDYVTAYPGKRNATVSAAGSSTNLYAGTFTLEESYYHSLYIVSKDVLNKDSLSFLTIRDDFPTPPTGKAEVRFINLSPDATAYSLELVKDTTTFAKRPYKTFTPFKGITPAKYTVLLKNDADKTTVATLENVEIASQEFYTIYAKGITNTTTAAEKLSLQVSRHKLR